MRHCFSPTKQTQSYPLTDPTGEADVQEQLFIAAPRRLFCSHVRQTQGLRWVIQVHHCNLGKGWMNCNFFAR